MHMLVNWTTNMSSKQALTSIRRTYPFEDKKDSSPSKKCNKDSVQGDKNATKRIQVEQANHDNVQCETAETEEGSLGSEGNHVMTVSTQTDILTRYPANLSVDESNFLRFCHLVHKVAHQAVRCRFDKEFPQDELPGIILKNKNTLLDLKIQRVITNSQWDRLFPAGSKPTSTMFDLTLMICLFRHVKKMSPISRSYDIRPPSSDISVGADLARIKYYRNKIAHCVEQDPKLDSREFPIDWSIVAKAVSRLGGPKFEQECASLLTTYLDSSYMDVYRDLLLSIKELEVKLNDSVPENIRENIHKSLQHWKSSDTNFVQTRAAEELMRNIKRDNIVIVTGSPGSGKSFTVQHVLLCMSNRGYDVIPVRSVSDIVNYFCRSSQQIFYIDDLLGKYDILRSDLEDWERNTETLKDVFKYTKCIFTCRLHIYKDDLFKNLQLDNHKVINFTGDQKLSVREKRNVGKKYLDQCVLKNLSSNIINNCVCFPLLCSLYDKHSNDSQMFFEKPEKYYKTELDELKKRPDKLKYACITLLVMCNNNIPLEILEPRARDDIDEVIKGVFEELEVNIMSIKKTLKLQFESLVDTFFKRSSFGYQSTNTYLFDIFCAHVSEEITECFISFADSQLLCERAVLKSLTKGKSFTGQSYDKWISERSELQYNRNILRKRFLFLQNLQTFDTNYHLLREWYLNLTSEDIETVSTGKFNQSMIIIPTEFEDSFFLRIMKDYNNGQVCDVFESYQMTHEAFRSKFKSHFIKRNQNLNIVDKEGQSAIYMCSLHGYSDILETICSAGGDVNLCVRNGPSPLLMSIEKRYAACAKVLIKYGADVNFCDKFGITPLLGASIFGLTDIVQLLFDKGADVNKCYIQDQSSLLSFGHETCSESLLTLGADVNKCDREGFSPLNAASCPGFTNVVQKVCAKGAESLQYFWNFTSNKSNFLWTKILR